MQDEVNSGHAAADAVPEGQTEMTPTEKAGPESGGFRPGCGETCGTAGRFRVGSCRWAELIPGGLVWATLLAALILSHVAPIAVMYFIILFDLYWVLRVCYFVVLLAVAWRRYRRDIAIDWLARASSRPGFGRIHHLIILPTYKEDLEIIRPAFRSLVESNFPTRERFIVVLGGEERDRERFERVAGEIRREFGDSFLRLMVTVHPKDIPHDLPGKSSNTHFMAHRAKEVIDELGIAYEDVIVSSFDVDTCAHPQYFACVTDKYLTEPNPTRCSYQPAVLYNNNVWDASPAVRVAVFGTTFWLMSELVRPERMFTFSSHSMSFRALVDVGLWERDIVTEDSRIFLQCFLRYDGDYRVVPIHVPVSMDMVMADTHWQSLVNLYKQQRRWAWGVEHLPYMIQRFAEKPNISWRQKAYRLFNQIEGMYSWATAPLLIFLLGYLPLWLAPESARVEVFYQNTPHILEALMRIAMIGVFVSALVGFALLPRRPKHRGRGQVLVMLLQWALVPITFVLFGSIPAIDAQTRLMLGKYMGYNVTEKKRRSKDSSGAVAESVF
ncbi:MAG: glycosyltransferase family 2 protein [bacterium]